jgi:DNA-binding MarR family transcriptional regulator
MRVDGSQGFFFAISLTEYILYAKYVGTKHQENLIMQADDRLIYLLFTAQQKLRNHLKSCLSAEGVKVTVAQAGVLFLLKQQNGRTMTELSQLIDLDNSTVTGLIDRLEKSGFVSRNSNPNDRRRSHIYITPQGVEETNKAKAVIRRVNEEVKSGSSPEQIESFKGVLRSFSQKFR